MRCANYVTYCGYVKLPDTKLSDRDGICCLGVVFLGCFGLLQYGTNALDLFGSLKDLLTLSACFSEFICCKYIKMGDIKF